MSDTKTSMIFRIEPDLKKAFERVAEDKDLTASQLLRSFVRETVTQHASRTAQKDLFKPEPTQKASEPSKPSTQSKPSAKQKKKPQNAALAILAQCKKGM